MPHFTVTTTPHPNGLIVQKVDFDHFGFVQETQRRMMDTMDAQVREALIALGWTPPTAKPAGANAGNPGAQDGKDPDPQARR